MWKDGQLQICGAEKWKVRDPNNRWCYRITSWWEEDERKDFADWGCCKRSVRYGGRPVRNALKVKVASLNCMHHSSGASEAVWWLHWKTMEGENTDSPRLRPAHSGLAEGWMCVSKQYHIKEFIWSRHDKTSADATEAATACHTLHSWQICDMLQLILFHKSSYSHRIELQMISNRANNVLNWLPTNLVSSPSVASFKCKLTYYIPFVLCKY